MSLSPPRDAEGNSGVLVLRQLLRSGALTTENWLFVRLSELDQHSPDTMLELRSLGQSGYMKFKEP